jgi:hypothetical protein
MAVIRIDNGTTKIGDINYYYDYTDNEGEHRVFFTSETVPKLGDSINTETGTLLPLTGFIINNDPGFQAKRKVEDVWPHGTVDFK